MECDVRKPITTKKATEQGLTLVELMVAMAISLILGIVVLTLQLQVYQKSAQLNDVTVRDNEERAGLAILTKALQGAGYGVNWGQSACDVTLSYGASQAQALYPVWSIPASSTTAVPLSSIVPGYPAAGSAIASDIVLMTNSQGVSSGSYGQSFRVTQFGTTQSSSGQGAANSSKLPLPLSEGQDPHLQPGDTVLVHAQLGTSQVCYQVPVVSLTTNAKAVYLSSKPSSMMPSTGYSGFDGALQSAGVTQGITDTALLNATVTGLGTSAQEPRTLTAFFIGSTQGLPALIRVRIDTTTGTVLSQQPVMVGAVSLQTRYLVQGQGAAMTWAQVVSAHQTANVQAVEFALVVRTLHQDFAYTAPSSVAVPNFSNYPVPATEQHYHYAVLQSSVALRNLLWSQGS